jgi:hypothetical protein
METRTRSTSEEERKEEDADIRIFYVRTDVHTYACMWKFKPRQLSRVDVWRELLERGTAHSFIMASDAANDLSPYELARLERIRRNEDRLRGLGLIGFKSEHEVTSSVGREKKVQRVKKEKRASIATRSSKRLRELGDGKRGSHEEVAEDDAPGREEMTLKDKVNYVLMPQETEELDDHEFQVYAALRSWRLLRKNELEVEPYKICQNRTLCELIRRRRNDIGFASRQGSEGNADARTVEQDLLSVWGIGPTKATQGGFGWEMLEVLDADENSRLLELSRVRYNREQKLPTGLRVKGICLDQPSTLIKTILISTAMTALHGVAAFTPWSDCNSFISLFGLRRTGKISLHCICINCARVTNCAAYHFVEEQHSQPHINKSPTWEPRNGSPTIQVHIRPDADGNVENALGQMWTEHEDQTRQAEEASNKSKGGVKDAPLFGEKQYDLSGTTSYEYDVIECDDFVLSKDAWVRNMPEEIRIANPDFVPT